MNWLFVFQQGLETRGVTDEIKIGIATSFICKIEIVFYS